MPTDAILLLTLLGVAIFLYASQWVSIEVTSIGIIVALAALGILNAEEALSGFSSPATITVTSMLVLSAALQRAGVVDYVARILSRGTHSGLVPLLAAISIPAIGLSAFMNNTPIVALMIPVALTLSRQANVTPSKILMPLSYFAILGGTCTLFGSSTNILVDALYKESGGPGFEVFEFAPLGLIFVAVGVVYILFVAPRLLPDRTAFTDLLAVQAPGRFLTEVELKRGSKYLGMPLGKVFPKDRDVSTLQIVRDEEALFTPGPEFVLKEGDVLYVESTARSLRSVFQDPDFEQGTAVADEERVPLFSMLAGEVPLDRAAWGLDDDPDAEESVTEEVHPVDMRIAEAVVTPASRFLDQPVKELGLSRKHGVQVLALRRHGRQHQYQLRELRLSAGDVLLVQGQPSSLRLIHEEGDFLLVEGIEKTLTFPEKAPLAALILIAVVALAAFGILPIVFLALAGIGAMLATRCIDLPDAVRSIQPSVFFLLAGTIPLGIALQRVGLADQGAEWLVKLVGGQSPWILVGALYLFTNLLTELVSNNATAVLLAPIAMGLSTQLGIDPKPLLIAIAFGASASFSTPIGYQTNTLVMGPGGYRFSDYLRVGLPLNLIMAVVAAIMIPIIWPLG